MGGPCDGEEQQAKNPPPTPEFLRPRAGNIDAVYRIKSESPSEYVFEFTGYREREA